VRPFLREEKPSKLSLLIKKIKKLYNNLGIDTEDIEEDEFVKIAQEYEASGQKIDKDLKESEKHQGKFKELI
jgi:hypothetical protein